VGRPRRADGLTTPTFVRAYPSGGMAGERRLNWGADATDAKWRSEHDTANSRFVVAEDLDGGTVVLEIDETAGEVVSRYPLNLSGNNLVDGTTTVYDASTDTVGDGTTNADHASVSTESIGNDGSKVILADGARADGPIQFSQAVGGADGTSTPDIYATDGTGSNYPYDTPGVMVISIDGGNELAFVNEFGDAFAKLDDSGNLTLEGSITENGTV